MEKKEPIKISLPMFITVIVLLVAIISGIYVFMQNQKLDKEIAGLKEQISKTQTEKNELQEKLNKVSDVASNTDNNEKDKEVATDNKTTFSNEQVKESISNYLELWMSIGDSVLKKLTEKGELNYNPSEKIEENDVEMTKVKFSDYKKAMLNYVSESVFYKDFNDFIIDRDGYAACGIGIGGPGLTYTVLSVTKNDDVSYTAKTSCVEEGPEVPSKYEDYFTFTVKDYNGHCVIDSINKI